MCWSTFAVLTKSRTLKNYFSGVDDGADIDPDLLRGIYERIVQSEFQPGADHVAQVSKVEQMIVGECPVSRPSFTSTTYLHTHFLSN